MRKHVLLGLVIGLITVITFTLLVFYFTNPGLTYQEYQEVVVKGNLLVPFLSVSLLLNFLWFFLFIKLNKDEISKGVLISTVLVGIVILAFKFL